MTTTTFLLIGLLAAVAATWVRARWMLPLRRLRAALKILADEDAEVEVEGDENETTGHVRRIADRLRGANARASEENLNLRAVLGSLSEGVLIIDAEERIRLANRGLQGMLGLANPPLNRPLLEVLRNHEVREAARRTLRAGESRTLAVSLTVRQPDGSYGPRHFQLTTAPIIPDAVAEPVGAIAVLHDITQLKNLENVRREFVANVSHELRTPLSIINGYLETMLEPDADADPETVHRFHETMWKHGQRLRLILDDLMTLARLESPEGAGAMRLGSVSLRACVEGVADRLAPVVAERRASVRVQVPGDLPSIDADADRLDQVFFNLIDNALRHAAPPSPGRNGKRGPEIVVRAELDPAEAGSVHLTVADNGQGIPLADQPHVFERFYRVHKDRFRQSGGTGLGLSIVKHIVRSHGGQVSVESAPGSGATFHVRLPVSQGAQLLLDRPLRPVETDR